MGLDPGLRLRLLLLTLSFLIAWLAWREAGGVAAEVEAARQRAAAAATADAAGRERAGRRERFADLAAALGRRDPPPETPAQVRDALVAVARRAGVEVSTSRVQPLLRAPAGTRGAEVRVGADGDPTALRGFLNAVEGKGWPLRTDRVQLGLRDASRGSLMVTFTVLWPDPETPFTEADAIRVVEDPRIGPLAAWLVASLDGSELPPSPPQPPILPEAPPIGAVPAAAEPAFVEDIVEAPPAAAADEPRLLGFVEVGRGLAAQAALGWRDRMTLVAVGDRIGDYVVTEIEPADAVVLVRPDAPPLRLTLR